MKDRCMKAARGASMILALVSVAACTNGHSTSVVYWPGHVDAKAKVYRGCDRSDRCVDAISIGQVLGAMAAAQQAAKPKQVNVNGSSKAP